MPVTPERAEHWERVAEAWVQTEMEMRRSGIDPGMHRAIVIKLRDALADAEALAITAREAVADAAEQTHAALADATKMRETVDAIARGWCCWWCKLKTRWRKRRAR